ncbi:MAG: polyribonucleotide nucleotidyltransferase [bacterium]|nr:polyribonucleotide nucleotidyltransferase [bacterium]
MITTNIEVEGRKITIESGKLARQANGAVTVKCGETVVLVTTTAKTLDSAGDGFPLMVDWRDRFYAAGKFPGGFFKREGSPRASEIISARLTDRSIRPLFSSELLIDLFIYITVLSIDEENDPDVLGIIGASAALTVSDIPFENPVAGVRVGKIGERLILNPTFAERKESSLEIVVAGGRNFITMVEAGANEVSEDDVLGAIDFAQSAINKIVEEQERMREGIRKAEWPREESNIEQEQKVREKVGSRLKEANLIDNQQEKERVICALYKEIESALSEEIHKKKIYSFFEKMKKETIRKGIIDGQKRWDGRFPDEIRNIACETGILPRIHGSALFTRGQTQSLVITTLGTTEDEQRMDEIKGKWVKRFILHYNFPPWSTGEAKSARAPGRREIGHGALAERALEPVIPSQEDFPYAIRVVSEILESNGSSSMASVCGGTLSLMDAGVPILRPVAGVAMGLVKEEDKYVVIADITGKEDHIGDMDFKVAGTEKGITALQMDIKVSGLNIEIMRNALAKAKEARSYVLARMLSAISASRKSVSLYAPKVLVFSIKQDRIRDLIGPGGRTIKSIIEATGAKVNVTDDGKVTIFHTDEKRVDQAFDMAKYFTEEAEIGKVYKGKVMRIVGFGAFIEILPGQEGLLHISEIASYRINSVEDFLKEGDEPKVKVINIDSHGKISLSIKQMSPEER